MHTNATNHTGRPDLAVPIWTIDHVAAALHHWSTRTTTVMVGYSPAGRDCGCAHAVLPAPM